MTSSNLATRTESSDLSVMIKSKAKELGFDHCRIVQIEEAPHANFFDKWIAAGNAGEMHYLTRNLEKRRFPHLLAKDGTTKFRSLIILAVDHHQFELPAKLRDDPSLGLIASYAWGDDYHEIIRPLLYELDAFICHHTQRSTQGEAIQGKCLVDTGPVLERDWAQKAGIGFTGKNCCTISPKVGSWLLLATVMIPEVVTYDKPIQTLTSPTVLAEDVLAGLPIQEQYGSWNIPSTKDESTNVGTCGGCTRCLDTCPTDAFVGPFHLNPQRCISYWTIESRQPIPRELRPRFQNRIFGCDICQEVCPWNQRLEQRTPLLAGLQAQSARVAIPLLEGFSDATPYWLKQSAFSQRFRDSPLKRAKRQGMLRNVCIALGNWASKETIAPLIQALHDPEPLVRGHAAWALGQAYRVHRDSHILDVSRETLKNEEVMWVRDEIMQVLQ